MRRVQGQSGGGHQPPTGPVGKNPLRIGGQPFEAGEAYSPRHAAMAQDPNRTDIRIYAKDGGWVFDFTLAPYGPDTLLKLEAFLRLLDEVEE